MKQRLIFIPALMCDFRLYNHQISALNKYFDIDVICFNNVDNINNAVEYLFNKLFIYNKNKIILAGMSMGGYIAMSFVAKYPNQVEKLCLLNTTYVEDSLEKKNIRLSQIAEAKQVSDDNFIGINNNIIDSYIYNKNQDNKDLIVSMVKSLGRQSFINQQHLILSKPSYENTLIDLKIPTLIIGGMEDLITKVDVQIKMHTLCKTSKLALIDKCGHLSTLDQPQQINNELLNWLI